MDNIEERFDRTLEYLATHPELFDRFTKDGRGGRVAWLSRRPRDYDGRYYIPWSEVRGRYWYPWRE